MTRLSQEHDDQAHTDPDPDSVAHLVALHIACRSFAPSIHVYHPTGVPGNVSYVHLESDLYIVGIRVHHRVQAAVLLEIDDSPLTLHISTALHANGGRSGLQPLDHFSNLKRYKDHVPALGCRVSFQYSHRASHRRPSLVVRSASSKVHRCNMTTPLSRGVCTNAAPQNQRTKDRQQTATQTRRLSSGTSAFAVYTEHPRLKS